MRVRVLDTISSEVVPVLSSAIEESQDIRVAVAFMSQRGLEMLQQSIDIALDAGARLEFLVGLDMDVTDPTALNNLHRLSQANERVALYCYIAPRPSAIYHPKLYLMRNNMAATCIIGSSNLTEGGLRKNLEVNVLIEGNMDDEPIAEAYTTYTSLKFHPKGVVPDDEFLSIYADVCSAEKQQKPKVSDTSRRLRKTLTEKAGSLHRPKPSRLDIIGGWLELIYETLPAGEFTNAQVYINEEAFANRYPGNQNVKAKIRQQLQILSKLGFIEDIGRARWRKL